MVTNCSELNCESYPLARKRQSVQEDHHGTIIADPYRWLEDFDSSETQEYVRNLNRVSRAYLDRSNVREIVRKRLRKLWNYERYGCFSKRGDYYYYYHNTGLQNQNVLYQQKTIDEKGSVFLDPNILSEKSVISIRLQRFSEDGSILAYGLSDKGSDLMTLHFRTADGIDLEDTVADVKHSGLAWMPDKSGVFYSAYTGYKRGSKLFSIEKHEYHQLFFHRLGTPQESDVVVAAFPTDSSNLCFGDVSEDGRYLIVDISKGCSPTNMIYYYDLSTLKDDGITESLKLLPLFDKSDAKYEFIDNDGETALILTNHSAPMFKLIRTKFSNSNRDPSTCEVLIVENENHKLDWITCAGKDRLVVAYVEDLKTTLYVHCLKSGKCLHQIPLEIGTVTEMFANKFCNELFILFMSFYTPYVIYHCEFEELKLHDPIEIKEIRCAELPDVDISNFTVNQVFASSRDGTQVPIYILGKKLVNFDGNTPTFLTGYGGFNIGVLPKFSISHILFIQHFNGIVASATLRGGDEYGEKWHQSGMLGCKQNVFDDFIAAAEYLVKNKYTSPNKLAIHGISNGGLLVAVCSQQRPDLFGAVINEVGVLDMLRFHKFGIGTGWIPEYGDPDDPNCFDYLYKYSPLHNIRLHPACQWPATLLMTADHDDRVAPSHSLKYIATLYEEIHKHSENQTNPIIIRVEADAGHGAGKPTYKLIDHLTDVYSFLQCVFDLTWSE